MNDSDLKWLRRQFIVALAADDDLYAMLVLKGGNALSLVHDIGHRASTDIDYSMEADTGDANALGKRIFSALRTHLAPLGFVLFSTRFTARPTQAPGGRLRKWGGYEAEFKLVPRERFEALGGEVGRLSREALTVSPGGGAPRSFRIQISKYEYCDDKMEKEIDDGYTCQVYSLGLIAAEKLRSLCQQMPEYSQRTNPAPRAQDFYDIHALVTEGGVEFSEERMHELIRAVFRAKEVPLTLLARLSYGRDFHRHAWPDVQNSIPAGRQPDYDYYFEFVLGEVQKLQALWEKKAP